MSSSTGSSPLARNAVAPVAQLLQQRRVRVLVDQLVHHRQALEGVLAVEDARLVGLLGVLAAGVQRAVAERAVDRRAADQHRIVEALRVQLLDRGRHLLGGRDEQRGQADRGRFVLDRGVEDRLDRHLLAEVDDRVAVVREDRVDERLADVVHVAEHGREHDRALRVALDLVEVFLQLRDRALHHFGRLQHERQDQFAGAELVADLFHRRQQHLVERRHRADLLDRLVDPVLDALLAAAQDVEVQRLLRLHPLGRVGGALHLLLAFGLEVLDEPLQRVLAAVVDEVVGQLALDVGDLRVGGDVVRVDHRQVEARLDAVVQEGRVEHRARAGGDAEGDVRDARARSSRRGSAP